MENDLSNIIRKIRAMTRRQQAQAERTKRQFGSEAERRLHFETHPDYVFIERFEGYEWRAARKSTPDAQKIQRALAHRQKEKLAAEMLIEAAKEKKENPIDLAVSALCDFDSVTKVQIRQQLDSICQFSIENLQAVIVRLQEEGIEVNIRRIKWNQNFSRSKMAPVRPKATSRCSGATA